MVERLPPPVPDDHLWATDGTGVALLVRTAMGVAIMGGAVLVARRLSQGGMVAERTVGPFTRRQFRPEVLVAALVVVAALGFCAWFAWTMPVRRRVEIDPAEGVVRVERETFAAVVGVTDRYRTTIELARMRAIEWTYITEEEDRPSARIRVRTMDGFGHLVPATGDPAEVFELARQLHEATRQASFDSFEVEPHHDAAPSECFT